MREAAPGTPEALAQIVEKALAKNPDERFPSAGDMLVALRQARGVSRGGPWPGTVPRSRARPGCSGRAAGSATHGRRARPAPSSRSSVPPTSPGGSRRALLIGLALARPRGGRRGVGAAELRSRPAGPAARAERRGRQPRPRAIDSQVEVARRRLDAGSFQDAAREAERALKLDPQNAGARQVLEEAGAALKAIDDAVAAVRSATAAGDRERVAGAAFDLMKLDPAHPEAERAAAAAGAAFRPRAEEARRLEQEARRAAEQAGSEQTAAFAEAARLEQKGEQALRSGQTVAAARRFLEARLGFERARRDRP